jgi:hypothetical protein
MKKTKTKVPTKKPMCLFALDPKNPIHWAMDYPMVPASMIVAADSVAAARKIGGWAWVDSSLSTCKKLDPSKYTQPTVVLES